MKAQTALKTAIEKTAYSKAPEPPISSKIPTPNDVSPRTMQASNRKRIPKEWLLIPRELSLHHFVSRALRAFDTHGDVFQLVVPVPLNMFCMRKPDHIKAVSSLQECGTVKPAGVIPKADFFMGNGLFNDLGGATWEAKRRVLAPAFSATMARHLTERLPHSLERMKSRWTESGSAKPIDLYAELQRLVLDYGAYALFSEQLSLEKLDWVVSATNFVEKMFVTLSPLWLPLPSNLEFRRVKTRYHEFMHEIIQKHRQAPDSYTDMVSYLISETNLTNRPYTDDEIKAEMFSAYFGTPAMALTILWGVFFLFTKREMLSKVRQELKSVIGDRAPHAEDLASLPYLDMFVKEVLRLYPSFWGSLRYAKEPVEFDGYFFPANSAFAMMRVAAQRVPEHWENPNEFIPERHAKRNACPHALLPFGLGPRMCMGRSLATMVCPLAIAWIAQNFDVGLVSDEIELHYGLGLSPAKTMHATAQRVCG